ncbi:MAG: efflux RND transporter periplasmic adaptor subunit [Bacteroidales bacterium]
MKRTLIITGIVATVIIIGLFVFNKLVSKKEKVSTYVEVNKGLFEVTVANSGSLIAEKSLDVKGPEIASTSNQGPEGGRGFGGMGRGGNMRAADFKILDIVSEGTIVKKGDYIAQLDKTTYDNTLKDELTNLDNYKANLEMKMLDTAVTLSSLRDDIKNQKFVVEEAQITLEQSKYEPPATIREAEISLDQAKRNLEQLVKGYGLQKAEAIADLKQTKRLYSNEVTLVKNLQDFLSKFTITAPAPGIVIYKTDFGGTKRKAGSSINAFDRIVATLPDLTSMISKLYVSEIEVNKVRVGQKVTVTIDAIPGKTLTGKVFTVANIGEVLPNSDAKMFEVQVRIDGTDNQLRPEMTTWNKILIKSINDAVYIPTECVQTGADSIPYVFRKNHTRQIVVLGDMNEKDIIVKAGLEPGTKIYLVPPAEPTKFKLVGKNLVAEIRKQEELISN